MSKLMAAPQLFNMHSFISLRYLSAIAMVDFTSLNGRLLSV